MRNYPAARRFHADTSYITGKLPAPGVLESGVPAFKEYFQCTKVKLSAAAIPGDNFQHVLCKRHSRREFSDQALSLDKLGNILFAGYGLADNGRRMVPSAGALYPLELYVVAIHVEGLQAGIYHYLPQRSELEYIHPDPLPAELLKRLFLYQSWIAEAGAIVIATAVLQRSLSKYLDRGYRYILLEAGHAFQNMHLMAAAHDLCSVTIGAFLDEEIAELLQVWVDEEAPIYALAIGNGAFNSTNGG